MIICKLKFGILEKYIIENGKEIIISLPEGKNTIQFTCELETKSGVSKREKESTFNLTQDGKIEISCFSGIISIDKIFTGPTTPDQPTYKTYKEAQKDIQTTPSPNNSENFFVKLWNNNSVLIYITIALLVLFGIIFSNSMMLYIISMIICLGGGVFVSWIIGTDKVSGLAHLGRSLLIAFLVGIVIVIGSFGSSSSSNKDGDVCGICGGDGVVTSKILVSYIIQRSAP